VTKEGLVTAVRHYKMQVEKCKPLENAPAAARSAELVNLFIQKSFKLLNQHTVNKARRKHGRKPANLLLLRDAGNHFPKFPKKKDWAIVADMPLEVGIGRLAGLKVIKTTEPTFTLKDYPIRAKSALATLKKFNHVYVHIKGPDLFGHDGEARRKTKSIEEIDWGFFSAIRRNVDFSKTRLIVTADHTTACIVKAHTADPVPVLALGAGMKRDRTSRFTEKEGRKGKLGMMKGMDLLKRLEV
jgi:2,3-bisphosphoglycerate-independent phosphoglycerate mutase